MCLAAEHARICTIVGVDHARIGDRQAALAHHREQLAGLGNGVADIAAAVKRRIGEAVDEIDDQERRARAEAGLVTEALTRVDVEFLIDGAPAIAS